MYFKVKFPSVVEGLEGEEMFRVAQYCMSSKSILLIEREETLNALGCLYASYFILYH